MADLQEIELGDGTRIKTALSAEKLADWGIAPVGPSLGERGALALGPFANDKPPTRADVTLQMGADGKISAAPPAPPPAPGPPKPSAEQRYEGAVRETAAIPGLAGALGLSRPDKPTAEGGDPKLSRFGATTKDFGDGGQPQGQAQQAPAGPSYVTIKAGDQKGADVRVGFTTKKSAATDALPEYQEQQADARIDKKLAAGQMADVKTENLKRELGDAEADRALAEGARLYAQRQQEAAQARMRQAEQNVAALQGEWENIQKDKVNPNEYWEGLGTGGRILAGIGMMAGGIRAGIQGGPNQAIQFIRQSIRDNINDQKDKVEARRAGFNVKKTMLEKTADLLGGNLALAEQVLEAKHLAVTQAMIRAHNATGSLAAVPAELATLYANLDAEGSDKMMGALGQYGAEVVEQNQFMPDRVVAVGGGPRVNEKDVHQLAADEEKAGIGEKEGDYGATIDLISQLPEGELPTIDTRNVASRALRGTLDFMGGTGTAAGALDSPAERKAVAQVEKIKGKLRHELSGAAVNEQEQAKLDQQLDGINTREGLTSFATDIKRRTERRKSGIRAGFTPDVVETYESRKKGYSLPGRPSTARSE